MPDGGSGPQRVRPAQLPAAVAAFTGRDAQLDRLDALLATAARRDGTAVVITAIAGMAGVGKTALAVHWAHRVRDRFPDGQLYVNLHGFATTAPMAPLDALGGFLQALGIPAEQVPTQVEQASAQYRSLLADRRVLVVLDNAADAEQVRPLLPGGPGCQVVVTSRNLLGGLVARDGAQRVALDVLAPEEAQALLTRILGTHRTAAEPHAVADLAKACAYLPLALRVAAANLTGQPGRDIAGFVADLSSGDRLTGLQVDGDDHAVRVAFDQSYTTQPAETQRLFRLLGLLPGADITTEAAAALTNTHPTHTTKQLHRLTTAHLLTEHQPGRYTFHDLLRAYATDRAHTDEPAEARDAATRRLDDWYLYTVDAAARLLYPEKLRLPLPEAGAEGEPPLDDDNQALAWLDAERPNLLATIRHAAEDGPRPTAWLLADALRGYFLLEMRLTDWLAAAGAARTAAECAGDLYGQAAAALSLADAYHFQSRYPQAIEHYRRAAALSERLGWLDGQSVVLGSLALVYWLSGRLSEAADQHAQSLELSRRTGRISGQATSLLHLAMVYDDMGQLARAYEHYAQAAALYRKTGARGGEALTLTNLGTICHALGRSDEALDHLTAALRVHRELRDWWAEAATLAWLAEVHGDAGRHQEAMETARTALALAGTDEEQRIRSYVLNVMAGVYLRLGRHAEAIDHYEQAMGRARESQARWPEAVALVGLAAAHQRAGQLDDARTCADAALDLSRRFGYRVIEGQAGSAHADLELALDRPERAVVRARRAVAIQEETGHRRGGAQALLVLGQALQRTGDRPAATDAWQRALAVFTDIGAADADRARALLHGRSLPGGPGRALRPSRATRS